MVEWGGLENRCAFAGTVGSNPTLSANYLPFILGRTTRQDAWSCRIITLSRFELAAYLELFFGFAY